MKKKHRVYILALSLGFLSYSLPAQQPVPVKPRILIKPRVLISTDIGDPRISKR